MWNFLFREELDDYVKRLRSGRGGSLNGMGMDDIVTQVSDMIFKDQQTKISKVITRIMISTMKEVIQDALLW